MKKILIILLILAFTISMFSCINTGNTPDEGQQGAGDSNHGQTGTTPDQNNPNNNTDNNQPGQGTEETVTGSEKIINVYLIAGQSNAVGYGMDTGNKIANSDPRFKDGFDNVLYYASLERWNGEKLDEEFQPVTLGMGVSSDRSGAEIGIASSIADNGEMNAIIKCAQGATHLYPDTQYDVSINYGTWTSPSYIEKHNIDLSENPMIGYMYTRFENSVREGIEMLIAEGYTPVIKGVWWMQGEAEMFTVTMASAYRELYETLISDTRNMLSDATGYDCSSTPFICGLPKWNTNNSPAPTYQNMVRTALTTVSANGSNLGYVDCMPLTQHDDWHFDAAGQKYLGEKFIETLKTFENDESFETKLSIDNEIQLLASERGLGFKANLTSYNSDLGYSYGFIVLPTDDIAAIDGDYIFALDAAGISYTNIPCSVSVDKIDGDYSDIYFTCSITDIAYKDLNTSITAIAYVKDQYGSYLYSSKYVSDSISRLASEKLYEDGADVDAIQRIVNAGINYLNSLPEQSSENDPGLEIYADDVNLVYSETSVGHQLQFSFSTDAGYYVRFSSENPDIVSIDENGVLTANGSGSTYVVIECAGKTKRVAVTVDHLSRDGVTFDGVISDGEYAGALITDANANLGVKFAGMTKNGNLYLSFELTHGKWAPYSSQWWKNDNIEFKIDDGASCTVVFYNGVAKYSNNITYATSNTVEVDGKLVTVVELCVEGVEDIEIIKVGFNGAAFGWLGTIWNDYHNIGYITADGIKIAEPINMDGGLVLDGVLDDAVYTDSVKNNSIVATGNGANVEIIGTLIEGGVLFGVTVDHTKEVTVPTGGNGDWYTYMNLEFHFNSSDTQFIAIAHSKAFLGELYYCCNTVSTETGFRSTFEIFIPYEAIGVDSNVQSLDFTARGWLETGWCDLLNSSWNATHTVSVNGITEITN